MKKILAISTSVISMLALSIAPAFAHVVVKPAEVGVAAFQTFSMGVPTEKDNSTVAVKLMIPDGVKFVSPNVKPGWTIDIKKDGTGEDAKVTEIDWTGGEIPPGQRDDFYFSAQVPAKETTLQWKAYQTYQDGSVVAWAHSPSKNPEDDSAPPPYSTTKVVNDLTNSQTEKSDSNNDDLSRKISQLMVLSVAALALSVISLGMQMRKKNN